MQLKIFQKLLDEFDTYPKTIAEPTYLEICKYPKRRFEEICSRLLCFYFNPNKEHNFNDLFLSSLFELLGKSEIKYSPNQVKVITEDNADGKRIDLVIFSTDFVIGIENKITAPLNNPLETYKYKLEKYNKDNTIKLILSVSKITKTEDLNYIEKNGFIQVLYSDFFDSVKNNIGQYISSCNQKYLVDLYDFIQTIEKMSNKSSINSRTEDFFYKNGTAIDEMIKVYESHKTNILEIQKEEIRTLKESISEKSMAKWWAWQDWDLGYKFEPYGIGIESSYSQKDNSPLGEFKIYITSWNMDAWKPYKDILKEEFPNNNMELVNNRYYLHMDIIEGNNQELIIEKLLKYYNFLKQIIK